MHTTKRQAPWRRSPPSRRPCAFSSQVAPMSGFTVSNAAISGLRAAEASISSLKVSGASICGLVSRADLILLPLLLGQRRHDAVRRGTLFPGQRLDLGHVLLRHVLTHGGQRLLGREKDVRKEGRSRQKAIQRRARYKCDETATIGPFSGYARAPRFSSPQNCMRGCGRGRSEGRPV